MLSRLMDNIMEQKMKKFGVNSTLLLTSLSLVACGGGGSEGYYNNEGSNNNTDNSGNESETDTSLVAESLTVSLRDLDGNVIQQAQDATKVQFAVKVLNADKGGIAEQNVVLNISDTDGLGVTSAASKVASGSDGIAIFELDIPTIQADSGKVNLTATVEGTTIQQVYTLNIKKASVIVSDYNLSVPQGTVINLPAGTADLTVQVTDTKGGAKSGQTVQLTLPEAMNGKFSISNGSSITTDSAGQATFTIKANTNLTSTEITNFVNSSQELSFKLVDENQAEKNAVASITFKDISTIVNTLEVIPTTEDPIAVKGGKQTIRVYAKNSNGIALASKTVKLATDSEAYDVFLDKNEAVTNAQGYAEFELTTNSNYVLRLTQNGIKLTATYADGNTNINGTATVQAVTSDETADDQEAIQRLEIASSYQMNASADSVTVSVKGVNFKGVGAKQGRLTLELNDEATVNGVTFDGSATQDFANAKDGVVTYTIKTNAKTDEAVQALVESGIKLTFNVEGNDEAEQTIKIGVSDEVVSEDQARYITIDPIEALDYTQSQEIEVIVQAIGTNDDGGLAGQSISLKRVGLTENELKRLRLAPEGSMTQATDENGFVTFKLKYTADGTPEQKALALAGLSLQAISSNGKTQTAKLNFVEPNETSEITLQSLNIDTAGIQSLEVNKTTELTVLVNAVGSDGQPYSDQKIGLGLNQAPLQNGAVIVGGSVQSTQNGTATFKVRITPKNASELANLVANGLTIAVSGTDTTISATRTVQLTTPAVTYQDIASLEITPVETSLSTLGGETRVKVVAKDASGQAIPNTPLSIALSSLTSTSDRVSLSYEPEMTNSKGEAEFTVTVSEGDYDPSLIKSGITLAVVGSNLNNSDRVQQTSKITVTVPTDALTPRLTAESKAIQLGATTSVKVAVKDELGVFTSGTPVRLSLNQTAIDAGVTLSSDVVVVTSSGAVSVDVNVPLASQMNATQKQELLTSGIQVTGRMTNASGSEISTNLSFSVEEPVNTNQINISPIKTTMDVSGDRTIVTVNLADSSGQVVANQEVTLSANNAATLIIGNPGGGASTNTSTPQTVTTDSNGNAFFAVEVDSTADKELLLASGIELTATHTNEAGVAVKQISRLTTFDGSSSTTIQPARYSLRIASAKPTLNVRSDTSEITVTLFDENGGGVANQYVEIALDNFNLNGASIQGPSGLTTNDQGQATFTVNVDESARNGSYSATEFASDDLRVTASFSESGYDDATQVRLIDVVQATIVNPVASIVIGVNPTEVASSSDGVYYTKNMSVSVVDFDGKPLANQVVTLDSTPLTYNKGRNLWALAPKVGSDPAEKWVFGNQEYYNLSAPNIYLDSNGKPMNNNGTPSDLTDDYMASTTTNSIYACAADPAGTAVGANNTPVKVVTFVSQSGAEQNTFTTDANGKFDFAMRYPKIYAQWLTVQVGASATVASLPNRTTYSLGLASLASDYSSDGTYSPNEVSPYGTSFTCP